MFEEPASTVGTSGMSYMGYESPIQTTVEELDAPEEQILDVVNMEPYNYMEVEKNQNEAEYERSSMRKYRMVRRKPAQTFYCRPCNKEIKYPSKIAEHLRKHTGERPYLCQICGAGFSQGHVLKVHLRGHHGELPYKCSFCSHSFPSLVLKKQHEKSHYQPNDKGDAQVEEIVIQDAVENEPVTETVGVGDDAVEGHHIYACPVVECCMQSHSKEEVEEHIAVVHGEIQEWIEDGTVYEEETDAIVVNEAEQGASQVMEAEQQPILVTDEQQYDYYPYEESAIVVDSGRVELQQPEVTLENGVVQALATPEESAQSHHVELYEHFTYVDDPNVPPPTEEIEVETSEQQYILNVDTPSHVPLEQAIIYDSIVDNDIDLYDVNIAQDEPTEERVRVLIDPKPPKKGRLTYDEYYDRMVNKNMQEMEVDAATIEMAAPVRHVRMMTEDGPVMIAEPAGRIRRNRLIRSQSDRPHGARNLDWIIDAVARGIDVDAASPHNRKKPVMHKCQYCGRVDKYPSKIEAHLRTHTGEKPFKCDICGMTFAQRTPMRLHVRRHLDQKPYICTIEGCGLRFVSGALLNYHQQTKHFMTKRYICLKGCGRFFASARNQRNHEARCFYNTEQAHEFGDAIYEHLVYHDQEEEEASDNETMLTVETLHSLVIEPKKPPVVEHLESSVMTDEQQVCDQATDVMERRSVAVGTEVDETKVTAEGVMIQEETIRLVESLLRETANSNRIFDRLRPFHTNSLVRLQPIRSSTISTLIGEALPVSSMSCGSAGRTAILIGENEHETWCSHSGRVVIAQRSRFISIPLAVCPSSSAWSTQGVMAVGDVAGDVHLVFGDTVLSTIKVHSQAVSSLDWTPHSQLVSCGTDGHIAVLQLKGTSLEIGKSLRLSVSDLPRRIRKSSSSAKSLSIVAMSRFGEDLCVASETGGLWLVSMPDLRLKTIASEPQAIQSVLYLPPLIALCGDDESTALLLNDGSFVDALPIAGVHQCKVDNELLVLADGTRMLIYDVTTRTVMFDEKRPTQSMSVSPQGDLVVLNENELVTFRLMKDNA